ncbi:unnamed protein product [Amoebophrya sp. A25]|nr:unnamed protein product [Amoebophrya sp. A25]|eukprot:GSA25T00025164001.1
MESSLCRHCFTGCSLKRVHLLWVSLVLCFGKGSVIFDHRRKAREDGARSRSRSSGSVVDVAPLSSSHSSSRPRQFFDDISSLHQHIRCSLPQHDADISELPSATSFSVFEELPARVSSGATASSGASCPSFDIFSFPLGSCTRGARETTEMAAPPSRVAAQHRSGGDAASIALPFCCGHFDTTGTSAGSGSCSSLSPSQKAAKLTATLCNVNKCTVNVTPDAVSRPFSAMKGSLAKATRTAEGANIEIEATELYQLAAQLRRDAYKEFFILPRLFAVKEVLLPFLAQQNGIKDTCLPTDNASTKKEREEALVPTRSNVFAELLAMGPDVDCNGAEKLYKTVGNTLPALMFRVGASPWPEPHEEGTTTRSSWSEVMPSRRMDGGDRPDGQREGSPKGNAANSDRRAVTSAMPSSGAKIQPAQDSPPWVLLSGINRLLHIMMEKQRLLGKLEKQQYQDLARRSRGRLMKERRCKVIASHSSGKASSLSLSDSDSTSQATLPSSWMGDFIYDYVNRSNPVGDSPVRSRERSVTSSASSTLDEDTVNNGPAEPEQWPMDFSLERGTTTQSLDSSSPAETPSSGFRRRASRTEEIRTGEDLFFPSAQDVDADSTATVSAPTMNEEQMVAMRREQRSRAPTPRRQQESSSQRSSSGRGRRRSSHTSRTASASPLRTSRRRRRGGRSGRSTTSRTDVDPRMEQEARTSGRHRNENFSPSSSNVWYCAGGCAGGRSSNAASAYRTPNADCGVYAARAQGLRNIRDFLRGGRASRKHRIGAGTTKTEGDRDGAFILEEEDDFVHRTTCSDAGQQLVSGNAGGSFHHNLPQGANSTSSTTSKSSKYIKVLFLRGFRVHWRGVYRSSSLEEGEMMEREYTLPDRDTGRESDFTLLLALPALGAEEVEKLHEQEACGTAFGTSIGADPCWDRRPFLDTATPRAGRCNVTTLPDKPGVSDNAGDPVVDRRNDQSENVQIAASPSTSSPILSRITRHHQLLQRDVEMQGQLRATPLQHSNGGATSRSRSRSGSHSSNDSTSRASSPPPVPLFAPRNLWGSPNTSMAETSLPTSPTSSLHHFDPAESSSGDGLSSSASASSLPGTHICVASTTRNRDRLGSSFSSLLGTGVAATSDRLASSSSSLPGGEFDLRDHQQQGLHDIESDDISVVEESNRRFHHDVTSSGIPSSSSAAGASSQSATTPLSSSGHSISTVSSSRQWLEAHLLIATRERLLAADSGDEVTIDEAGSAVTGRTPTSDFEDSMAQTLAAVRMSTSSGGRKRRATEGDFSDVDSRGCMVTTRSEVYYDDAGRGSTTFDRLQDSSSQSFHIGESPTRSCDTTSDMEIDADRCNPNRLASSSINADHVISVEAGARASVSSTTGRSASLPRQITAGSSSSSSGVVSQGQENIVSMSRDIISSMSIASDHVVGVEPSRGGRNRYTDTALSEPKRARTSYSGGDGNSFVKSGASAAERGPPLLSAMIFYDEHLVDGYRARITDHTHLRDSLTLTVSASEVVGEGVRGQRFHYASDEGKDPTRSSTSTAELEGAQAGRPQREFFVPFMALHFQVEYDFAKQTVLVTRLATVADADMARIQAARPDGEEAYGGIEDEASDS